MLSSSYQAGGAPFVPGGVLWCLHISMGARSRAGTRGTVQAPEHALWGGIALRVLLSMT